MRHLKFSLHCLIVFSCIFCGGAFAAEATYQAGVAQVDITPDYPIRLSGFGGRRTESEGVTQKIWAKALAIREAEDPHGPAVLLCVDNLGVPDYMTREVASRLQAKANLDPARLAVTSTHTHTAPMLRAVAPTLFGRPIPAEEQARIDRYTHELTDQLEAVALAALKAMKPATLEFGTGAVGFAINRRTPGGPVDHDLPLLAVRDPDRTLRALFANYACHCVTLSHNKVSGDWAGYARQIIEAGHPGVISMISIGCGADQNPESNPVGDRVDIAEQQGRRLAKEVARLLEQGLSPVTGKLSAQLKRIQLPFDAPPSREHFEKLAKQDDYVGYHARVQLETLDRGEKLQTEISYPIQTWTFGDSLAMVFLPGEVVVDYSLRLKRELDRSRLIVNAYSNDVPCYIPSERVLKEGGYEGAGAMIFYNRPTRLAPGLEDKIVEEIHRQIPDSFNAPPGTEGVAPRSPEQSRQSIRTSDGLEVELVAAEPLVASPVAIDWSADGRLWVCEMYDYPTGADNNWTPGGRVKVLRDTNDDGRFDEASVFLENIPFPTGVTAWGDGVLVCAAPDILYARDTNGDGKADKVEKLFSGFATGNYQARVNSLSLGLDNWIHGANGLLGGTITGGGTEVDIRNHDFRFRPLSGPMETVTGLTQQGRVRDDWGRWFGCDNSRPLLHYPHEARYLRRNPHAPAPPAVVAPTTSAQPSRVFPVSRTLERFNDPANINQFTSACGLGLYRDTLLGEALAENAFTAEPVHNLVHRMIVSGEAGGMSRRRAEGEAEREFLASSDNWFRPVQVRTGPDGALYVVDMYRFLIEHPRWIAPQRLAQLDVRAGADMGRIYRIRPKPAALREVRDLRKLSAPELAEALDSPNGTERDRVHVELMARGDRSAAAGLEKLAKEASLPQVRVQALAALEGLRAIEPPQIAAALTDADARVRAHAIRLCEPLLSARDASAIAEPLLARVNDESPIVRRQLAFTLGEWTDARAGEALAKLAAAALEDDEMRVAVLSSAAKHCGAVLSAVMAAAQDAPGRERWIPSLIATAAASGDEHLLSQALLAVLPAADAPAGQAHFAALASLFDAVSPNVLKRHLADEQVSRALAAAREVAADASAAVEVRESAVAVLGRDALSAAELDLLCDLVAGPAESMRTAALTALRRQDDARVGERLLAKWHEVSPGARAEVINLLITREQWAAAVLNGIRKRQIQPTELSLTDRQRLLESEHAALRDLAELVLPPAAVSSRADVMERFVAVGTLSGSPAAGAEIFTRNCATCHAHNGIGHEVGPDLSALRGRDADYFVKNILDPSAVVEPRFVSYVIAMKDGRTLSGLIKAESTATLTVATGGGAATETLSRGDIRSIRATSISMMPDGLEAAMNPQQMADLIAFLKSGAKAKSFAGNAPRPIEPDADGSLMLPATAAEIYGATAVLEPGFDNIGYWQSADDQVAWTIRISKDGEYAVHLDYACAEDAAGNAYAIEAAGKSLTGVVAATGPDWSRYRRARVGTLRLEPGEHRLIVRPDSPLRSALMDLRAVALAAPGSAPKWPAEAPPPRDELLRDPAALARFILDNAQPTPAREAAINANPQFASELIVEMTRDLAPGAVEYERIPWIWRVSIACGKRNDAEQIRSMLNVSLPEMDQPLRDWQAVVIGGGIINGISQKQPWPGERLAEIVGDDEPLKERWQRALELSSAMADDEKVPPGTRYDALRMLGVEPWEKRGEQLVRYLGKETNAELQMGAVSGLADMNSAHATAALIASLADLTDGNRALALDALLRDASRANALLDALEAGTVDAALVGAERITRLKNHPDEAVLQRAGKLP